MVQGKVKIKTSLPKNVKQKSATRMNKAMEMLKFVKQITLLPTARVLRAEISIF